MRIAIVCNGRSGSTSLFNLINCQLINSKEKYTSLFEPFNFVNPDREDKYKTIDIFENKKNILIKTFIDRDNYPYKSFDDVEKYWEWVYEFFDKIIVLERENKREQAESLFYHIKISNNRTISPNWHKPKFYELTEDDETHIQGITKHLESDSEILKSISNMGYPLFTYEELFVRKNSEVIKNLLDYLELNHNQKCIDEWVNSPYKKVRLDKKINGLI